MDRRSFLGSLGSLAVSSVAVAGDPLAVRLQKWYARKMDGYTVDKDGLKWMIDTIEVDQDESVTVTFALAPGQEAKAAEIDAREDRILRLPKERTDATMARGYQSYSSQFSHTVWHLGRYGVGSSEARALLSGLSYAQVDDVHDCMHTKGGSIPRAAIAELRRYKAISFAPTEEKQIVTTVGKSLPIPKQRPGIDYEVPRFLRNCAT